MTCNTHRWLWKMYPICIVLITVNLSAFLKAEMFVLLNGDMFWFLAPTISSVEWRHALVLCAKLSHSPTPKTWHAKIAQSFLQLTQSWGQIFLESNWLHHPFCFCFFALTTPRQLTKCCQKEAIITPYSIAFPLYFFTQSYHKNMFSSRKQP